MDSPKSNPARENAIPSPVAQIISAQSKAIAQLTKINEDLSERFNTLLEKFTNYDLNRIKLYDESMKYFMQQKQQPSSQGHGHTIDFTKAPINFPHINTGSNTIEAPQAQQTVSGGGPLNDERAMHNTERFVELFSNMIKLKKEAEEQNKKVEPSQQPSGFKGFFDDLKKQFQEENQKLRDEISKLKADGCEVKPDPQRTS